MNRISYTIILCLAAPLLALRLLWRSRRNPAYLRRWSERFACYPRSQPPPRRSIVFHAVSVGEVHAAEPLVKRVMEAFPDYRIVLTTSTPTGSDRVRALFGDRLTHLYLPYDFPGAANRFLKFTNPLLLVLVETELWPNLIHRCHEHGVMVFLANARMSEKSFRNYRRAAALSRQLLRRLALASAQSESDGERLLALGLDADRLHVGGNMKFDVLINADQARLGKDLKKDLGGRPVLVAASTRQGEEEKLLSACKRLMARHPRLLLIIVPRHPERFQAVHRLVLEQELAISRHSEAECPGAQDQVFLGDTMGKMAFYYALADLAFVGGSLVDAGCQSIIEPAAMGLPVIAGPSLYNFKAASESLLSAGGMRVVADENELAECVLELLGNEELMARMAAAASAAVKSSQGATARNFDHVSALLEQATEGHRQDYD